MDNKMWYIYTMEYYAAEKNNDIMKFAGKWMELENVILSKDFYCCDKTPWTKSKLGRLCFQIIVLPWKKSEQELKQGRNLEAGADAEAMEVLGLQLLLRLHIHQWPLLAPHSAKTLLFSMTPSCLYDQYHLGDAFILPNACCQHEPLPFIPLEKVNLLCVENLVLGSCIDTNPLRDHSAKVYSDRTGDNHQEIKDLVSWGDGSP
ncbi:hypothetical protein STEG23_014377, partial [Scotinomys teguina]